MNLHCAGQGVKKRKGITKPAKRAMPVVKRALHGTGPLLPKAPQAAVQLDFPIAITGAEEKR